MISKELLSEALGISIDKVGSYTKDNNLYYSFSPSNTQFTNIYELAYRCKEWAIEQGFSITSTNSYMGDLQPTAQPVSSHGCEYPWVDGDTEPEAIFQVSQWILDNKEPK